MVNTPRNSSFEHKEKQPNNNAPIFSEVTVWETKYPSYIRPDWTPFTVWWQPIIVLNEPTDSAQVIMNLKNISNPSSIDVLWENNQPKVVNLGWIEFLCKKYIDKDDKLKVSLKSNTTDLFNHFFDYPLEIINRDWRDMLLVEKNELFYSVIYIDKFKTHSDINYKLLYKKWDKYLPTTFEWESFLHGFIWIPDVDGMSLWDVNNRRLIYWDKEAETFRQVVKGWIVFENVHQNSNREDYYTINIWDNTITFSKSLDNPNEPASIEINWVFFLVKYTSDDHSMANISIWINNFEIEINKPIIINWRTFYKFWTVTRNFTDWINFYSFELNSNKEIKTFDYQGKEYPIIADLPSYDESTDSENSIIRIYHFEWTNTEKIILMKNPKYNPDEEEKWEKSEEIKKQDEYIRLKLTPEQSEKNLINTSYKHWIICLSNVHPYDSSPSWYEFYKINSDGTLNLVFKNANNISIKDNVTIECYDREVRFLLKYTLIRRPGTSSIFEPINFQGKPCLVAEWKNLWTITYISIENFSEIIEQYTWPNPDLIGSINRFEMWWETLFYNNDWSISLLNKKFHLVNFKGKLVESPEKAIFKVWDKEILLLAGKQNSIIGYFVWMKSIHEMIRLNNKTTIFPDIPESEKREAIKIQVDNEEYIYRNNFPEFRALWICEPKKEHFSTRYVCNVWNADKISWKEFMCDWKQVIVKEIYSEEYVIDNEVNLYYRQELWNELKKVIPPKGVKFNDNWTFYIAPHLYNYIPENKKS